MMNCEQLTDLVIKRALYDLNLLSDDLTELLIFTCANESLGGTYLQQVKVFGLGIYNMLPKTYNDIWQNYIQNKSHVLIQLIHNFNASTMPDEHRLIYDLRFATAMAALHYARIDEPLPKAKNLRAMYDYYKSYYNTHHGKDNFKETVHLYSQFTNRAYTFASPNCS